MNGGRHGTSRRCCLANGLCVPESFEVRLKGVLAMLCRKVETVSHLASFGSAKDIWRPRETTGASA